MGLQHFLTRVHALLALRGVYSADLAEMADAILRDWRRGAGSMKDLVHRYVASHSRTRSESSALETLLVATEHRDARGAQHPTVEAVLVRAYFTVRADVIEELLQRGECIDQQPE